MFDVLPNTQSCERGKSYLQPPKQQIFRQNEASNVKKCDSVLV